MDFPQNFWLLTLPTPDSGCFLTSSVVSTKDAEQNGEALLKGRPHRRAEPIGA
jgi:hypothetical protein